MLILEINYKKNKTKLKQMKESDYGSYMDGKVFINVEKISKKTKSESSFIKKFSTILMHETLHFLIEDEVKDDYIVGEEKAIRKICKEPWNKLLEEQYADDAA